MVSRQKEFAAAAVIAIVALAAGLLSVVASAAAAPGGCVRNQLAVASNGSEGAAGTIYGSWIFTNVSNATCTLSGYPSLQLYGRRGRPIPTRVRDDLAPRPSAVTLKPGRSAIFRTSYSDVSAARCPVSSVIQITPPGVRRSLFIPAVLTPCRGLVHVSAVRAQIHRA